MSRGLESHGRLRAIPYSTTTGQAVASTEGAVAVVVVVAIVAIVVVVHSDGVGGDDVLTRDFDSSAAGVKKNGVLSLACTLNHATIAFPLSFSDDDLLFEEFWVDSARSHLH